MTTTLTSLPDRYISVWNEPDADARRALIASLWVPDGRAVLEPPEDVRATAGDLGIPHPTFTVRGYAEIESRVARAYEEFVAPGTHVFRIADAGKRVGDLATFSWEYAARDTGEVSGFGTEIMLLAADGRIEVVYQLIR